MPGPVAEVVAVAGRRDDVAGDARRSSARSGSGPPAAGRRRPRARRSRPPGRARPARRPRGRAPPARRRTASGSCRSGSRRPARRNRTAGRRRRGPAGRPASRAAAPPRGRTGRRRRRRAPRRRRSASATRARARGRPRSRPAGSRAAASASARSATAQAAAMRSSSAGSLIARSASIQPSTGTSSTSGAAAASRVPERVRDEARLDRDAPRADRRHELRPARRQVAVRPRRAARRAPRGGPGSCSGESARTTTSSPPTRNWPEIAGDLLLALAEGEAGQVAHVLAPDAEVGVDAGAREARPEAGEAGRAGGPVGLDPAGAIGRRRAAPRSRPATGSRARRPSRLTA